MTVKRKLRIEVASRDYRAGDMEPDVYDVIIDAEHQPFIVNAVLQIFRDRGFITFRSELVWLE